jgi:hypothetical protein
MLKTSGGVPQNMALPEMKICIQFRITLSSTESDAMKASFLLLYHAHHANKHDFVNSSTMKRFFCSPCPLFLSKNVILYDRRNTAILIETNEENNRKRRTQ